MQVYRSNTA